MLLHLPDARERKRIGWRVDFDANVMPDNQGYYGYHRTHSHLH